MSFKIFTWMDELFDEFSKANSYRLGPGQKQFVMRGLGLLVISGIGLGIVFGLIFFGLGMIRY